jgi:hypothetical protein
MFAKLSSERGKACHAKRKHTVEPVFGQLNEQQAARRFTRRGLDACQAEWKPVCGTHNLLKLWRHTCRHQLPQRRSPERRRSPPMPATSAGAHDCLATSRRPTSDPAQSRPLAAVSTRVLVSRGGCITSAVMDRSAVEVVGAVLGTVSSRAG